MIFNSLNYLGTRWKIGAKVSLVPDNEDFVRSNGKIIRFKQLNDYYDVYVRWEIDIFGYYFDELKFENEIYNT